MEDKEYSFIWHKEMVNNGIKHYTKPFRTKVKAKSKEEAIQKVTEFVAKKMKLVIVEEHLFDKTILNKVQVMFEDMSKEVNELFKDVQDMLNKTK